MNAYPKIRTVTPHQNYQLLVTFSNDTIKVYDCRSLLNQPAFSSLSDPALFQMVRCDQGGYGVVWNDDLDLSESELWLHGQIIPTTAAGE